ncbi:MAG TPA: UPF0182 family protein, partial [Candidatus Thermoplasmatota archaeon]
MGVLLLGLPAIPALLVENWFLESLGRGQVFLTNFRAQALLFLVGGAAFALAAVLPARRYAVAPTLRGGVVHVGLWVGAFAGWLLAGRYQAFLLALHAGPFGEVDPVFGNDVGLYVFTLPAVEVALETLVWCGLVASVSALVGRYDQLHAAGVLGAGRPLTWAALGSLVTDGLNAGAFLVGWSLVARTFLARYGLLFADSEASGVRLGADYLDLEGLFSTLNLIHVSTVVEAGVVATVGWALYRVARAAPAAVAAGSGPRPPASVSESIAPALPSAPTLPT